MINLETTDSKLVGVAIGKESGSWYVQTTDFVEDTYLSESIEEGLKTKEHALIIANLYIEKYGFELFEWGK